MAHLASPPPQSADHSGFRFRCESCPKQFKRIEHLRRHERSHLVGKHYECAVCGKCFARSDVLSRHEFIHKAASQTSNPEISFQPKQARACVPCARARDRCSREVPCQRCSAKSLNCVYLNPNTTNAKKEGHKARKPEDETHNLNGDGIAEVMANSTGPSLNMVMGQDGYPFDQNHFLDISSTSIVNPTRMDRRGSLSNHPGQPTPADTRVTTFVDPDLMSSRATHFQPNANLGLNWLPISEETTLHFSSILDLNLFPDMAASGTAASPDFPTPSFLGETEASRGDQIGVMQPLAAWSPGTDSSGSRKSLDRRKPAATPPGGLYATSISARTPTFLRDKALPPLIPCSHPQLTISKMDAQDPNPPGAGSSQRFSPRDLLPSSGIDNETPKLILPTTYETLRQEYRNLCIDSDEKDYPGLEHFPSITHVDMLLHLFYDRFIPALPISHHITRNVNEFWLLTLAMTTIGCQYTRTREFEFMVVPLHRFLRKGLQREMNSSCNDPQVQVHYLKAFLLSQIGHFYYSDVAMRRQALLDRGVLVQLGETMGLFASEANQPEHSEHVPGNNVHSQWQQWVRGETKRRLGYSIWMLDLMVFYHFNVPPLLPNRVPEADLPHDGLWTAPDEHEWLESFERTKRNPGLRDALNSIFLRKKVKPDLGEFGRILLLHGVYHEVYQVKAYFQRPLSSWVPTAQPGTTVTDLASSPESSIDLAGTQTWLSETATFVAWRNAALDCVDELHWWANGVIALQSGTEHPTVHHLHFSRVVLLVPVKEILTLLLSITKDAAHMSQQTTPTNVLEAEQEVIRWAHRDESKARLAIIHCGCVFWHLRRFSNMAFYEAQSVFHATLALWAYGYYMSQTAAPPISEEAGQMTEDEEGLRGPSAGTLEQDGDRMDSHGIENPDFIWLDRPNDDEMVQYFVRSGRPVNMKAYISGVGDIYEPTSPAKILRQGLRILESVAFAWGRDHDYVDILQKAERVMLGRNA